MGEKKKIKGPSRKKPAAKKKPAKARTKKAAVKKTTAKSKPSKKPVAKGKEKTKEQLRQRNADLDAANVQTMRLKRLSELSLTLSGDPVDVFNRIAQMIAELMNVPIVALSEIRGKHLHFLSVYVRGEITANADSCLLEITPCATVEKTMDMRVYQNVAELFPEAEFLRQQNAFSYCGFPALDNEGNVVAVICLLDDRKHEFTEEDRDMLRIFSQRIGMEIERQKQLTERKRIEEALMEREERLHILIDAIPDIVFFKDARGRHQLANKAFEEVFGMRREDVLGKAVEEILPPAVAEHCRKSDEVAMGNKKPVRGEEQATDKDGNRVILDTIKVPLYDESGNASGLVVVARDVTERKRTEDALKNSHDRFNTVLDSLDYFVYVSHFDTYEILYINKAVEDRFGDVVGNVCWKTFQVGQTGPCEGCPCGELLDADGNPAGEIVREDFNEHLCRWYELRDRAIKWVDGSIVRVGIVSDITERKEAEEALRLFSHVMDEAPDGIHIVNLDGTITYSNKATEGIYGYTADEVKGRYVDEFNVDPEFGIREVIPAIQKTGRWAGEVMVRHKDGREFPVWLTTSIVKNVEGEPIAMVGIIRDITERKEAEELTKASLKEKELLLREIHHRVKNNMQIISSLLNLQSRHVKDADDAELFRESQDRIRAMALVHEELYRSKDFSCIDLGSYIGNLTRSLCRSYSISGSRVVINADVHQVDMNISTAIPCGLIINELVSNSLKHAFPDGRKGEIRVSLKNLGEEEFELTVSDNGVGMSHDPDLDESETMGLQLIKGLAEQQLNGRIEVDMANGTEFKIIIKELNYRKE
jgi:PAS domain S-box-containing protein